MKKSSEDAPAISSMRSHPKGLVCPDDNSIPRIGIYLSQNKVYVEIQCDENQHHKTTMSYEEYSKIGDDKKLRGKDQKCSLIPSHKEDQAQGYCIICKKWVCKVCIEIHEYMSQTDNGLNHRIIKEDAIVMNVKPFCNEDRSCNNYWHCLECSENGCKKCKTSIEHQNHKIIDTTETLSINDANNGIKKYKDFEVKYFDQLLKYKTKGIEQITKWYDYNHCINSDGFDYVNSQLYMYPLGKETNNYNGLCNLKDICETINFTICYYDEQSSVEENTKTIIHFFRNNGILDLATKPFKCTKTIPFESEVWSGCKLPNEEYAVGLQNGDIKIIDYGTSNIKRELKGHTKEVWRGSVHTQNNYLISLSFDNTLVIWNHSLGEKIQTLQGHTGRLRGIVEEENGNIITCSTDKSLKFWDINSFQCGKTISDLHELCIYDVCLGKDKRGVTCGGDKMLKVLKANINTKDDITKCIEHNSQVCSLLQGKDERLVVGTENEIMIYDVINDFKRLGELKGHTKHVGILKELSNRFVASGSQDHLGIIWDGRKYESVQVLKELTDSIRTGGIEWEQKLMISGGGDKALKIWEAK